jgi:hypothetical protein
MNGKLWIFTKGIKWMGEYERIGRYGEEKLDHRKKSAVTAGSVFP